MSISRPGDDDDNDTLSASSSTSARSAHATNDAALAAELVSDLAAKGLTIGDLAKNHFSESVKDSAERRDKTKKALEAAVGDKYTITAPTVTGNNAILFIKPKTMAAGQTTAPEVVLQIGERRENANHAVQTLESSKNTAWLARVLTPVQYVRDQDSVYIKTYNQNNPFNRGLNSFPANVTGYAQVVEKAPTDLLKRVAQIHDPANQSAASDAINLARQMGPALSAILTNCSKQKIIVTDFNSKNILIRSDGSPALADTKSASLASEVLLRATASPKDKPLSKFELWEFTTDKYNSTHFATHGASEAFDPTDAEEKAIALWEKEYSHQMAVALYHMATGDMKITRVGFSSASAQPGETETFDFNHPTFNSVEGKRLQDIITRLGAEDPNQRLHHKDAAKLLQNLDKSEKEYLEINKGLVNPKDLDKRMKQQIKEVIQPSSPSFFNTLKGKLFRSDSNAPATSATPTATSTSTSASATAGIMKSMQSASSANLARSATLSTLNVRKTTAADEIFPSAAPKTAEELMQLAADRRPPPLATAVTSAKKPVERANTVGHNLRASRTSILPKPAKAPGSTPAARQMSATMQNIMKPASQRSVPESRNRLTTAAGEAAKVPPAAPTVAQPAVQRTESARSIIKNPSAPMRTTPAAPQRPTNAAPKRPTTVAPTPPKKTF